MRVVIREVLNVGGFFAGETVTLTAQPWPDGGPEQTLTIDDAALRNVTARHLLTPGMILELHWAGERIDQATLLGAAQFADLQAARRLPPIPPSFSPQVLSFRCPICKMWALTVGDPPRCAVCGGVAPRVSN